MIESVSGLQSRLDLLRALMGNSESDGKCGCPGRKARIYRMHDGVPEGEVPSDRCEDCGGQVQILCINYVSNWRDQ